MRRWLQTSLPALALLTASLAAHGQEIVDRMVARVETDIILLSDVRELARYQIFADGKAEPDEQILNRLIDQWIVRSEANVALFPQPKDEDVERSLARLKRTFSSPEEYEERKKLSGLSDDDILRLLRSQLYLSNYLDTRFRPSIQVDPKAVEEFYQTRVVPRAESRGQKPPTLDAAREFIQEALVQRAVNEEADKWLKESRSRVHVQSFLNETQP